MVQAVFTYGGDMERLRFLFSMLVVMFLLPFGCANPAHAVQLDQMGCMTYATWASNVVWAKAAGADRGKVLQSVQGESGEPAPLLVHQFDALWNTGARWQDVGQAVFKECVERRGDYGDLKMSHFEKAFQHVVMIEGGYANDPADSGGKTKYGITEAVARVHGYVGEMLDMDLSVAERIYRASYWSVLRLEQTAQISYDIALEMFDTGVNCGVGVAGRFLQRSLNVLNRNQRDFPDLRVDGNVGPVTLSALTRFFAVRGPEMASLVMMNCLNCLQGARYIELAEAREKDEAFVFGWMRTRV